LIDVIEVTHESLEQVLNTRKYRVAHIIRAPFASLDFPVDLEDNIDVFNLSGTMSRRNATAYRQAINQRLDMCRSCPERKVVFYGSSELSYDIKMHLNLVIVLLKDHIVLSYPPYIRVSLEI
jgi:hypothetical protein